MTILRYILTIENKHILKRGSKQLGQHQNSYCKHCSSHATIDRRKHIAKHTSKLSQEHMNMVIQLRKVYDAKRKHDETN